MSAIPNQSLNRYEEFWERKNNKRPILNISYPKSGASAYREPSSLEEKGWMPTISMANISTPLQTPVILRRGFPCNLPIWGRVVFLPVSAATLH